MTKLILINGPPGVGKSTLARRYASDHPMALALDVDDVRAMLGHWNDAERQQASGLQARKLAIAMARVHLADGHDVVIPQLTARPAFVEELETLGADFHEIVLMDSRDTVLARFMARDPNPTPRRRSSSSTTRSWRRCRLGHTPTSSSAGPAGSTRRTPRSWRTCGTASGPPSQGRS